MLLKFWMVLLALSFLLVFLAYYTTSFFGNPNYVLAFLGFSFVFLLSIPLFTDDLQVHTGYNQTESNGVAQTTATYTDVGNNNIGFLLAVIAFLGAFMLYFQYETPPRMKGIT